MITPIELETFQECQARWKFSKDARLFQQPVSDYTLALKKTIFQMYSWLQEKNRLITDRQIRERWDKNWWSWAMDQGTFTQEQIMTKATDGWLTLEKYWGEIYIEEPQLMPVGINFEFSMYNYNVHYRVHIDLILANTNGEFFFRQLGGPLTEWYLYNSLATKLEIVALAKTLDTFPIRKSHIDLTTRSQVLRQKTLQISPEYIRNATNIVNSVSSVIKNKAFYVSPGKACEMCEYKTKCWM